MLIKKVPIIDINVQNVINTWNRNKRMLHVEALFEEKADIDAFVRLMKSEDYLINMKVKKIPHPDGGYQYHISGDIKHFDRNIYWAFHADALAYGGIIP